MNTRSKIQEKLLSIHSQIDIGLQSIEIPEPSHTFSSTTAEENVFVYRFLNWTDPLLSEEDIRELLERKDDWSNGILIAPNVEYMLNFDVSIFDLEERKVVEERNNVNLLVSIVGDKLSARQQGQMLTQNIEILCSSYNPTIHVLVPEIVYTSSAVRKLRCRVKVYVSKANL